MEESRVKVTYRVNPELVGLVRQIGEQMGISTAGVVDRLLLEGLERFAAGVCDFDGYLAPAARGRYLWTVDASPNGLKAATARRLDIT